MKLAFCLPKYFPFGGLQRNFLQIAHVCQRRGCDIAVYTLAWEGDIPDGFQVHVIPVRAWRNHAKNIAFVQKVQPFLMQGGFDAVIGFMKMPGLDIYYAADPCFIAGAQHRHWLYRLSARYRCFLAFERSVFRPDAASEILVLTETEMATYRNYYGTPRTRFHLLPPGISKDRMAPSDANKIRTDFRTEFAIASHEKLLLAVGSGFKTKGLDRTLRAMATLPPDVRRTTQLMVVGEGKVNSFTRLAKRLGVAQNVRFMNGRSDVTRFLLGADLLVHPAYTENTGNVLLEAIVAGLPVLTTANCGYAFHIERANAGRVVPVPFQQTNLNTALSEMLMSSECKRYSLNGIAYGQSEDLYSRPEIAADIIMALSLQVKE